MTPRPTVLYLSYDGLTDPLGQSQILPYLEGLSDKGYSFHIFSFEKSARFKDLKIIIERRCLEKNIVWHPMTYTKKPPILSTLHDLRKLYQVIALSKVLRSADLIHCRSYLTTLVAVKLKKRFGIPFIFDMRGFWADERVDGRIWNLKNPIYRTIFNYFKGKERIFLEEASAVVSLTHAGQTEIVRWFDEDSRFGGDANFYNHDRAIAIERKITVIPCAADLAHFDPEGISENKRKWLCAVHGLDPSHTYLGYVGSLGTWYMCDELIGLFRNLLKKQPQIRLLVLSHDDTQDLFDQAEQMGIPRSYLIHIRASRKEVPVLISLMSASAFFILPAYSKIASSPTKQGELMAMGVPVICNSGVGDSAAVVQKYSAGIVLEEINEPAYSQVAENWELITNIDHNEIRRGALEFYSLTSGVQAYAKIYASIITASKGVSALP